MDIILSARPEAELNMFLLENDTLYINNNPQSWDLKEEKKKKRRGHAECMTVCRFALGLEPSHEQYSKDDEVMLCQQTPDGC